MTRVSKLTLLSLWFSLFVFGTACIFRVMVRIFISRLFLILICLIRLALFMLSSLVVS